MKLKIAIAVPVYNDVESMFFQSITSAICYAYEVNLQDENGENIQLQIEPFVCSGIIQEARHRLFYEAQTWDADYILWCDSDHVFPADTIPRLWSHGLDIVGANYARRVIPGQPTAPVTSLLNHHEHGDYPLCYTTEEKAEAGELERVDHMGLGLCLMRMSILEALIKKAEEDGKESFMPLFHWEEKDPGRGGGSIGEDVYFFRKCREAGLEIYVDHALSWEVGHITKSILTHAHTHRDKKKWDEKRNA